MAKFSRFCLKSLFVFFPLAVYQIQVGGISVSIDRLIIMFALPLASFLVLKSPKKISIESFFYALFIAYAVLISRLYGSDFSSYGTMLFLSLIYFLVVTTLWPVSNMSMSDFKSEIYAIILVLAAFAFFTVNTFLMTSKPPLELPFQTFLPFVSSSGLHVLEQGGFGLGVLTRVALPFGRPQVFGMTCAILTLLLLSPNIKASKLPFVVLFVCLSLSASRSAIFPLIISGSVVYILQFGWAWLLQRLGALLFGLGCLLGIMSLSFPVILEIASNVIDSLSRLTNVFSGESSGLHLAVRSNAFTYIFESPFQTIFGSGVGSFQEKSGLSSAHSTYVTFFHDIGLIGLSFFLAPLLFLLKKSFRFRKSRPEYLGIVLYIIMAHFLYEVPNIIIFWFVLGYLSAQMRKHKGNNGHSIPT